MTNREPKLSSSLRIIAAGCIGLWLQASLCCTIECLCSGAHHNAEANVSQAFAHHDSGHSDEAEAAECVPNEANHSHDSEPPSPDSHRHNGGKNSCCSTLVATAQIATPFAIATPVFHPLTFLCPVVQARNLMLFAPKNELERQAKPRDRVFTPEVCLGPAFRSLAPPFSRLS